MNRRELFLVEHGRVDTCNFHGDPLYRPMRVFDADPAKITNIGHVLGPLVDVKISGTLQEVDELSTRIPKDFRASIQGGTLCFHQTNCIGLPIEGEGIFASLYRGERLRI
eukprot:scaffold23474_cov125-Cylindrotheca_fusiformis.AAC.5